MASNRSNVHLVAWLLVVLALPTPVAAGWSRDPVTGMAVAVAANEQAGIKMIPDGSGGVILVWQDRRAGSNYDIYAQRLDAAGQALWTANGLPICTAASDQSTPALSSDGAGGAIFTWYDYRASAFPDIYTQRVDASGVVKWTANGVAICTASWEQYDPVLVGDGSGGAIITWYDYRNGSTSDIFAQRVNSSGATQWTANGVIICNAANDQLNPGIVSDLAGGAVIAWRDLRTGQATWAQRVNGSGVAQWSANGNPFNFGGSGWATSPPVVVSDMAGGVIAAWRYADVTPTGISVQKINAGGSRSWPDNTSPDGSGTTTDEYDPAITSDGAGGCIVAWKRTDGLSLYRVYAQRHRDVGAGVRMWGTGGVLVGDVYNTPPDIAIAADGAGGTWIAIADLSTTFNLYAYHLNASGAFVGGMSGFPVSLMPGEQSHPVVAMGAAGQVMFAWQDTRNGAPDIYAQRVDRWERLGDAGALIESVRDVPVDQGSQVRLRWQRSYLDTIPVLEVSQYGIWRQVTASAMSARALSGTFRNTADDAPPIARPGVFRTIGTGAQATFWEGVGTVAARGDTAYSFVAPTLQDSTGAGNPLTAFMVDTHGAFKPGLWDSDPVSGYSVDNLVPAMPSPFTGAFSAGSTALHWGANTEHDFTRYHLYRGTTAAFVPNPGNLILSSPDTGYVDAIGTPSFYKLSAVDAHGNESGFALLTPDLTVGVPGGQVELALALGPVVPNPSKGPLAVRFTLPHSSNVSLAVFDAMGRCVRVLARGPRAAGEYAPVWNGLDDGGHPAASGIFFVRLDVDGRALQTRIVRLQ